MKQKGLIILGLGIVLLCICSPFWLSHAQNEMLRGNIKHLQKNEEEYQQLSLAKTIKLCTQWKTIHERNIEELPSQRGTYQKMDQAENEALFDIIQQEVSELAASGIIPDFYLDPHNIEEYFYGLNTFIGDNQRSISVWYVNLWSGNKNLMLLIEASYKKTIGLAYTEKNNFRETNGVFLKEAWAKYLGLEGESETENGDYIFYTDGETEVAYSLSEYPEGFKLFPCSEETVQGVKEADIKPAEELK